MAMPKLRDLQCLRAFAALLVVVDHAADATVGHGFAAEPLHSIALFLGAQGVAIFFIISGFIMTYTVAADDRSSGVQRAKQFMLRRVVRIVPLYWFFTAMIAVPAFILSFYRPVIITPARIAMSLFFIPYVDGGGNMTPVLPIGWTLNYEMFFYVIFAVLLLWPSRRRVAMLIGALGAIAVIGSCFYPVLSGANPRSAGEFLSNPIILLFGAGALVGWLKLTQTEVQLPFEGLPWVLPLLAINLMLFFEMVHKAPVPLAWSAFFWTIDLLAVALCVFGTSPARPRLEVIGDASYSLYLVHLLPLFLCYLAWKAMHFTWPLCFLLMCLLTSIPAGLLCYRWIERPLTRWASVLLGASSNRSAARLPQANLQPDHTNPA